MCSSSARRAEATRVWAAAWATAFRRSAELRLRPIGVGLIALSGAGEGRRQLGQPLRMDERFLRNGLLLECPQQIEVRHGHKQQQVVRGRCGGLPPGRHLLVGDARLEDGIGQGKLGRQAGDGRRLRPRRTCQIRLRPPNGSPR